VTVLVSRSLAKQNAHYYSCKRNDSPYVVVEYGRVWSSVHWDMFSINRHELVLNGRGKALLGLYLRSLWGEIDIEGRLRHQRKRTIYCGGDNCATQWVQTDLGPQIVGERIYAILSDPRNWTTETSRAEWRDEVLAWIASRRLHRPVEST